MLLKLKWRYGGKLNTLAIPGLWEIGSRGPDGTIVTEWKAGEENYLCFRETGQLFPDDASPAPDKALVGSVDLFDPAYKLSFRPPLATLGIVSLVRNSKGGGLGWSPSAHQSFAWEGIIFHWWAARWVLEGKTWVSGLSGALSSTHPFHTSSFIKNEKWNISYLKNEKKEVKPIFIQNVTKNNKNSKINTTK
jgi:hypothetical protein